MGISTTPYPYHTYQLPDLCSYHSSPYSSLNGFLAVLGKLARQFPPQDLCTGRPHCLNSLPSDKHITKSFISFTYLLTRGILTNILLRERCPDHCLKFQITLICLQSHFIYYCHATYYHLPLYILYIYSPLSHDLNIRSQRAEICFLHYYFTAISQNSTRSIVNIP